MAETIPNADVPERDKADDRRRPRRRPAPTPAQTGGEHYQTPTFQKAVAPPDSSGASATDAQPSGWGVNWRTGDVTMPQSVQDWGTLAAQSTLMGLYPGLTAQADAARKRLDPLTAGSADVAGSIASPTTLLNAVPVVGPELAGGVHEGTKSAVTNWKPDESWPTYLKNVGEDTAGGVAAGFGGQMAGLAAAKALPELIKGGVMAGSGWVGHKLLGGAAVPDFAKELAGLWAYTR